MVLPPHIADLDEKINKLIFPSDPSQEYKYKPQEFEYIDLLANTGTRYVVKEYEFKPLELRLAVKAITISRKHDLGQERDALAKLKREIQNFRILAAHPNIVDLYGISYNVSCSELMICMELMNMSLHDLYKMVHDRNDETESEKSVFPEKILGYIAIQVLEALEFCKSKNIIHRDVKPKNILLNSKGEVKLCDFGESRILQDSWAKTLVGTVAYWPPERFEIEDINESDLNYDIRSDIWSLGITLTEISYGNLPFFEKKEDVIKENFITIQHKIKNTDIEKLIERCLGNRKIYSDRIRTFVKLCLEKLDQRPKYTDIKNGPFFQYFSIYQRIYQGYQQDMANFIRESNNLVTETSLNENPHKRSAFDDWNILTFPVTNYVYEYDPNYFKFVDIIEFGRHVIKEYRFCKPPLRVPMAIKCIRISPNRYHNEADKQMRKLILEVKYFRELSENENIVNFYGLCLTDGEAMICMELMDASLYELYLIVHDRNEKFPEKILVYVVVKILDALVYCKSKNFIHRDVNPKNMLLNLKGEVKLCGFGESRILEDSLASTFVGTVAYWPPERFGARQDENADVRYGVEADVWSLGISLVEIVYGSIPFLDARENNRSENIVTIQHNILNTDMDELVQRCVGNLYSMDCNRFMRMCLERLDCRPNYDQLKETKFYDENYYNVNQKDMADFLQLYADFFFEDEPES